MTETQGQFLSDDERVALTYDRKRLIAEALIDHAEILVQTGMPAEVIQPSVDQLRDRLSELPRKEIKKIRKGLMHAAEGLSGIAPVRELPQLAVVAESAEPVFIAPVVPEPEQVSVEENQPGDVLLSGAITTEPQELDDDSSTNIQAADVEEVAEAEPTIDEQKPKSIPGALNIAFSRTFTYGQRAVLTELNEEQQAQFTQLLLDTVQTNGNVNMQRRAKRYAEILDYMLKGMPNTKIGELVGVRDSNIYRLFRSTLAPFIHKHKRTFVEGYTEILATTPELLERANNLQAPNGESGEMELDLAEAVELTEAVEGTSKKPKREKIIHPEGVPDNIDNALIQVLDFEQRAAIAGFSETQQEDLVFLVDRILAKIESVDDKDKWVGRFERLLGGMAVREVAGLEGIKHPLGIIQGFAKVMPRLLAEHKAEFIAGFEQIRTGTVPEESQNESEWELTPETDEVTAQIAAEEAPDQASEITETVAEELPNQIPEVDEGVAEEAIEDEPTVEMVMEPELPAIEEPVAIEPEQQEIEQAPVEPLVELMQQVYGNDDPTALQVVSELFSTRGVIRANKDTVEAARHLSRMIRDKNINLSLSIANPTARAAVESILGGIREGDNVRWVTFSQILNNTPEGVRDMKQRTVEAAFKKIAGMLGGEKAVVVDAREELLEQLRDKLPAVTEITREQAAAILDRVTEKDNNGMTPELQGALLVLLRAGSGAGLDDNERKQLLAFTRPRNNGHPMTVGEIVEMLDREKQNNPMRSAGHHNNKYVTATLLRSLNRIVVQGSDE